MADFIKFSGDVKAFARFTNSNLWKGNVEREIKKATMRNAMFLVAEIKKNIRARKFSSNSPLTLALKKSNLPLLNEKNLFDAIDFKLQSSFEAEVGLIAEKTSTGGVTGKSIPMSQLIQLMESGFTITVTPDMRAAIAIELRKLGVKDNIDGFASGEGKKTWVVPPRPFLSVVFDNPAINVTLGENWRQAIVGLFKKQGAK